MIHLGLDYESGVPEIFSLQCLLLFYNLYLQIKLMLKNTFCLFNGPMGEQRFYFDVPNLTPWTLAQLAANVNADLKV